MIIFINLSIWSTFSVTACVYIYTRWLPASLNFHTSAISRTVTSLKAQTVTWQYLTGLQKLLHSIPNQMNSRNPTCKFHIQQRRIHKSSTSQFSKINPILIPSWWICYNKFWLFFSSSENGNKLSSIQKLQHQATEETKLWCCQEVNCFWKLERKRVSFFSD